MIDLHCHILPEIDDGSKSWGMTFAMLSDAIAEGTTDIAWTPHLLSGEDITNFLKIEQRFQEGLARIAEWKLPVKLYRGGEIYLMPDLFKFTRHPCGTYAGQGKYCLVEFPMYDYHPNYLSVIQRYIADGLGIVVAHPERYTKLQKELGILERFVKIGAKLQVNAGSIRGDFGETTQKIAKKLIQKGWAYLVASDGHDDVNRRMGLQECYEIVKKWTNQDRVEELYHTHPAIILGVR